LAFRAVDFVDRAARGFVDDVLRLPFARGRAPPGRGSMLTARRATPATVPAAVVTAEPTALATVPTPDATVPTPDATVPTTPPVSFDSSTMGEPPSRLTCPCVCLVSP
jgi:hypothetical protein